LAFGYTQSKIASEINKEYDYVIRFEHLEEDLKKLPILNINTNKLEQIGGGFYGNWKEHYNPELEERIYKWGKEDFDKFGYSRWEWATPNPNIKIL
jgi:hypothetical protein